MTALIIMMIATYNGVRVPTVAWVAWAVCITFSVVVEVLKGASK